MLRKFYDKFILSYPKSILLIMIICIAALGYQARYLEIDASAETLLLEDDKDLAFTRIVNERYGNSDFLILTYTPKGDLLADATLNSLRKLSAELLELKRVESVVSILNVPLLESPPKPVKELLKNIPTLESPEIDKALAKEEFLNSPIYRDNLVSPDFKTTALLINLHDDPLYRELLQQRNSLRKKEKEKTLSIVEQQELEKVLLDFKNHRDKMRMVEHKNIYQVREIAERYRGEAKIFLGGASMVADDLITFIRSDLQVFGSAVLVFLMLTLWVIFRQLRWILLPLITCSFSVVTTSGFLGLFGWEVTVISSNFISIQLIITMAITIHLIVRYRELAGANPELNQRQLILDSTIFMARPCTFAVLTTVVGFASLVLSGILPVMNFGWMMSAGIGVSLFLTFLIFPVLLMQMPKAMPNTSFESRFALTKIFADLTERHGKSILFISVAALILSIAGAAKLNVENSFIDYFRESTEIYQGMKLIDQQLGGTTPLDLVVNLEQSEEEVQQANTEVKVEVELEDEDEFDAFEEEFEESAGKAQYWFTTEKMERIENIHDYLNGLEQTGKVLSLATMLKIGKTLNSGEPLDDFMLALLYNELPERFRKIIMDPYVSVENNEARFYVRIRDSEPNLKRNELLKQIQHDLKDKLDIPEGKWQLTNLLVLYNNMLQSLFKSQILTLGVVIVLFLIMFIFLFRSIIIALIAIFPNVLSIGVVLGFMGWMGIPLDMMTITIAAISVGIAVDNTIHYIHRFRFEFAKDRNYLAAMHRSHESIGYAMYYTSITIIIGFSILVLSKFIPSIYFGLLTGLAMLIALVAALTLLPQLLIVLKPLGPESQKI
ncbi:MAG TPA: RND family transporter [Candidatus Lambdaproteobacteria bacterium]|nr:RND family transporter [Candidatus Lambdaproteobacteria bacterium]HIB46560.1 RND family transporter [Candidatus Lambdaproteobacteria bacterium]